MGKGVWLGHARHTQEFLLATDSGIVKAYAVRRMPNGQLWDGERIRQTQGSPSNWKLDATEEPEMLELDLDLGGFEPLPPRREELGWGWRPVVTRG